MSVGSRLLTYIGRNLKALDQAFNALTGGNEDELLSSRAQKAKERYIADPDRWHDLWGFLLCDYVLNPIGRLFGQDDHGLASVERDEGK